MLSISEADLHRFQMHGQDIPELLSRMATARADHPALVWVPYEGDGQTWSYGELWADVRSLAAGLADRGIAIGDRVLIHSENCPQMVLSTLACATVGAVAVTTNTKSVGPELEYFIDHTRAVAAITQPRFVELISEVAPSLEWLAVIEDSDTTETQGFESNVAVETFEALFGDTDGFEQRDPDPTLASGIMFTSGTTSRPKAVVHTHANAIWASRSGPRTIDLGPDDAYLIYPPFFHVNAQTWSLFPVLGVGATAVLVPKWSQSRFWATVVDHGVTHISVMPFAMATLANPERPESHPLRVGVFGFVSDALDSVFGLSLYGAFGMTETVTHCISGKPAERLVDRAIGRVTPGYEALVVDPANGELCTDGRPGELWIRGTRGIQVFLEYADNPEANNAAFTDGWFKTGDIVRTTPNGEIIYVERDSDVLKVGGENVSAREVEDVIAAHPAIQRAAVVARPDEFLSEVPVAYVVPSAGEHDLASVEAEVMTTCGERLAEFKVPRKVWFVDEFPTGTLDKVLKSELRSRAASEPL